jgi:uncharacterized zinc-type alcohol dehydrogenase-like protein
MKTIGYAAHDAHTPMVPYGFDRRALRPDDVAIEILYCGVCHTDLHAVRNDFGMTAYPCVPGHEIIGRVLETGPEAGRYRAGELVAVGTMVDSCGHCDQCAQHAEQRCREWATVTYGGPDRITGEITQGGYSRHIVVRERFVLALPDGLDPARAAPLLCAGVSTWSPLRAWNAGPGSRVAVIGLGGLGHMAVKLAAGLGAEVTVISRSPGKEADALALGARAMLLSSDPAAMAAAANSFDLILDTVPVAHELAPYMPLLEVDGTLVIVGFVGPFPDFQAFPLVAGRRRVSGSAVGGTAETQELLDFCAAHGILPDCEMIAIQAIGEAFARMEQADVRYRFVIDMASLESVA